MISVIVPIVGVIIGLASAKDSFGNLDFADPVDETTYLPGQPPGKDGVNLHTIDGFNEMVAGLEEKTGATTVFSAVLYPRYAVLEVPEAATGKRYRNYYWDGHSMALQDYKSTTDDPAHRPRGLRPGHHRDPARGRPRPDRGPDQLVRQRRHGLRSRAPRRSRCTPTTSTARAPTSWPRPTAPSPTRAPTPTSSRARYASV